MYQSIIQQGNNLFLRPSDTTGYPVLNMMNMKYAILNPENPVIVENPNAMGNAWFVDQVVIAQTPNEESDALNTIDLHNTLVTDVKFQDFVKDFRPHHDSSDTPSRWDRLMAPRSICPAKRSPTIRSASPAASGP